MDDETYCKLDCSTLAGQKFYTIPKRTKPDVLLKQLKQKNLPRTLLFVKPPVRDFQNSTVFHERKHDLRSLRERMFKKVTNAYDPKA